MTPIFKETIDQDDKYNPRIAVVFSGGGAAGAYQAGVLETLEGAFADFRTEAENSGREELANSLTLAFMWVPRSVPLTQLEPHFLLQLEEVMIRMQRERSVLKTFGGSAATKC